MAAAAVAAAGPIQEGWDGNCNPTTFVVTPPLRKAERNANANGNHQVIRALQGFSVANGRPNAEFSIEIRSRGGGAVTVGVITAASGISNANRPLGNDTMSWGYYTGEGRIVHNNANVHANLRIAEAGAVVVVRLNCAANTVSFFVRGDQGLDPLGAPVPVTPNVELFPAVSLSHHQADVRLSYGNLNRLPRDLVAPRNHAGLLTDLLQSFNRMKAALPARQVVHLVLLGQYGVGKSAFIQTVLTALRADGAVYWHDDLITRPSADHVTTVLNKFAIEEEERKGDKEIHIWDTWGWMESAALNFVDVFLPRILRGQLPPATKMPTTAAELREMEANIGAASPMHVPIVFVSMKEFDNNVLKQASLSRLQQVLQASRKHCFDRDPVVVLTHCDVTPELSANPMSLWQNRTVADAVFYLSSALQVQPVNIFPVALLYGIYSYPRDDVSSIALLPFLHALRLATLQLESERQRAGPAAAGTR